MEEVLEAPGEHRLPGALEPSEQLSQAPHWQGCSREVLGTAWGVKTAADSWTGSKGQ